jgi:cobalt/nickel transport system permease protein
MAVLIPFIGYYAYNFISGKTEITSSRRVIAAAIAGWVSLTAAATWAGFILGLQFILYKDANGLPLYMPYPLSVTVPAMFLEHAFAFSFLEALVTGLIFAYLQRTDPSLFYGEKSESKKSKTKKAAPV